MRNFLSKSVLAAVALVSATPVIATDGATIYRRCAACHLPNGAGVPNAFPPLNSNDFRALVVKPEGRRYLALVVIKGLSGPIVVDGKNYMGVMPAQSGLDDAQVAAVLNHVATDIAKVKAGYKPFSAEEVAAARAAAAALTPAMIGQLHRTAGGK